MNKLLKSFIAYGFLAFNFFITFAYDCAGFDADIVSGEAPSPLAISCVIGRIINVVVLVAGLGLVYMILWGAFKLSMSQGDPKGYVGAQNTWFYAIIGFLIVVGFFALYTIMAQILGLPVPSTDGLQQRIEDAVSNLMGAAGLL